MDPRPTTDITLPETGARVVFYAYLNTLGSRAIKKAMLANIKINVKDMKEDEIPEFSELPGSLAMEMQDEALKHLVKEVYTKDGEKVSDPIQFIGNLPESDGDLVFDKADEISKASQLSDKDKKK